MAPHILFTDGAKYVVDAAGAYWLLDEIALAQRFEPVDRSETFQLRKLAVRDNASTLTCEDGNGRTVFTKPIPFTDFPGDGDSGLPAALDRLMQDQSRTIGLMIHHLTSVEASCCN